MKWEIVYGNKKIDIKANDVVETLSRTIGYMYYKLENDEKVKRNVQMKIVQEMDIQILELIKSQFSGAIEEERKHNVHLKVVPKRTVKDTGPLFDVRKSNKEN